MSDNTLANDDTGTSQNTDQVENTTKTYTQKEVDDMMARTKTSISKKYERVFEELGDLDELRSLKSEAERRRTDEAKKRGEFDRLMKELADSKDQEIRKRDDIIMNYKIDLPLVDVAAQLGAVNPSQVRQLLKNAVKLNESGEVEVMDEHGGIRYNSSGEPLGVRDLVQEFLDTNLHFKSAGPSTTVGRTNIASSPQRLDPTKFDMKDPAQRQMYREFKQGRLK